jgi:MFS family permease
MTSALERPPPPEPPRPAPGPRTALHVLRQRQFAPYFAGNALSASGTWFQNLAAALFVYRHTHSPFLLGVLNFAQFVPVLLLAPWAGSAADRYDRRRLLLVSQSVATVLSASLGVLALAGAASVEVVIVFALGLGVVSAFSAPAQQALVSSLVAPDHLQSAIALNSMTFNLARAAGPTAAAGAIAAFGIPVAFLINAGSYLLFVGGLLLIRPRAQRRTREARLRESLALLRREPRLVFLLLVVLAAGFGSDPVNTESPALAHAFGHHDTFAGLIVGTFGAGAVTAAFLVAGRAGSPRLTVATLTLLGGAMVGFAVAPSLAVGFAFLFAAGFGYLASNTRATTQLQLGVDETQRGRIMALWSIAFLGLRPLASLADGAVAGAFGVRPAAVALALPALATAAAISFRLRSLAAASSGRPTQKR